MIARTTTRTHVLVVDDEQDIAGLIKHGLEKGGDIEDVIVGRGVGALRAGNHAGGGDEDDEQRNGANQHFDVPQLAGTTAGVPADGPRSGATSNSRRWNSSIMANAAMKTSQPENSWKNPSAAAFP